MSACSLLLHLEKQKRLADTRRETVEVERLAQDISDHLDKCLTCSGVETKSLLQKLFDGYTVLVAKDGSA